MTTVGAGLGYVDYVLIIRELAEVDPSVALSVAAHNSLCSNHIFKFGNEEQRRRWLTRLTTGEAIGAWAPPSYYLVVTAMRGRQSVAKWSATGAPATRLQRPVE